MAATSFTVNSDLSITAVSPAHGAGTVDVTVTTPGGTSAVNYSDSFTYLLPLPVVTSLGTSSGPIGGGTSVTITGTNLTGTTIVRFGSFNATSFVVNSATSITAVAPEQGAGTVDVTVMTQGGWSATSTGDRFTYQVRGPNSVAITPATANGTVNQAVLLNAAFADIDDQVSLSSSWTVNGPGGSTSAGQPTIVNGIGSDSFQFTPTQAGTYVVTYVVTDNMGVSSSAGATITITDVPAQGTVPGIPSSGSTGSSSLNVTIIPTSTSIATNQQNPVVGMIAASDPNAVVTTVWTVALPGGDTVNYTTPATLLNGVWMTAFPTWTNGQGQRALCGGWEGWAARASDLGMV